MHNDLESKLKSNDDILISSDGVGVSKERSGPLLTPEPLDINPLDISQSNEEKLIQKKISRLRSRLQEIKRTSWVPIFPSEDDDLNSLPSIPKQEEKQKKVIIVSNRLIWTLRKNQTGRWWFVKSGGGLASALRSIKNIRLIHIGWPGCEVAEEDQSYIRTELHKKDCIPVFLTKEVASRFYDGFSNNVLWPLFHFVPLNTDQIETSDEEWQAYRDANKLFTDAVAELSPGADDVIWVHDYHLMLVPGMLRRRLPTAQIGFFLHIPFPNADFFKVLPQGSEILRGLLASNLIGFHIYEYALNFKNSCLRILQGSKETPQCIDYKGRKTAIAIHPLGIDPQYWFDAVESNLRVRAIISELRSKFKGIRIILGVDRLDYVKGLEHKLSGWRLFLSKYSEWVGKVVLIQICVPTRQGIPKYRELANSVHRLVGSINGKFGTVTYVPTRFLDKSIGFEKLAALYHVADACLITSLRDGMNLVAYEYVAAQGRRGFSSIELKNESDTHVMSPDLESRPPGILLLSKFTGAAQNLGAGAIRINPWDIKRMADTIKYALDMKSSERKIYHRNALQYVVTHTVQDWTTAFLSRLQEAHMSIREGAPFIVPKKFQEKPVMKSWKTSKLRLLVLGLVGTITQIRPRGMSYKQFLQIARVPDDSKLAIKQISADHRTEVVVVTRRDRSYVENLMGNIGCSISAENGYFTRKKGETNWKAANGRDGTDDLSWMIETENVMKYYMERTPNTFIDRTEGSIHFEYQDSDEFGEDQARDMVDILKKGALNNTATEMVSAPKSVHVRLAGVRKVDFIKRVVSELEQDYGYPPDFVFVAGNWRTDDEALFRGINNSTSKQARKLKYQRRRMGDTTFNKSSKHFPEPHTYEETLLPPKTSVYTCCIPRKASHAQLYLESPDELSAFLTKLARNLPGKMNVDGDSGIEGPPKNIITVD